MSDQTPGRRHFVSWVRRGIGASVNSSPSGSGQNRVTVNVQVSIVDQNGKAYPTQPSLVKVQLYGPGDVIGIDPRCIIKTEPVKGTPNFEPNYLCAIEFDSPDFPWMFTPAGPGGNTTTPSASGCPFGDRLAPWIALTALKTSEYTEYKTAADAAKLHPNIKLPMISVPPEMAGSLQSLADSWNWAHVQVNGDDRLDKTLADSPGNVLSRLLCPRRLDPETSYTAFLVPAFEIGRLAGLGEDISGVDPSLPAWSANSKFPLDLPVYYQFDFGTSDEGDFESLVRRLKRMNLGKTVGRRDMDVSLPGLNLPAAAAGPLGLEGALKSAQVDSSPVDTNFQSALQTRINKTSPVVDDPFTEPHSDDPVIAPPIYGRWPAGVATVDRNSDRWVDRLNLDPRTRAAAGLGTQVVLNKRTQMLASAWQQLDGILQANQKIYQGQLARATLQQVYQNKLAVMTMDSFLNLTAPLQARVFAETKTVRSVVRSSKVPERTLSVTYRRVTRPRRLLVSQARKRESLLGKLNDGKVTISPKPKPPQGLVSLEQISEKQEHSLQKRLLEILSAIELARRSSHSITRRFFLLLAVGVTAVGIGAAVAGVEVWDELEQLFAGKRATKGMRMSNFTPQHMDALPARPNFSLTEPNAATVQRATSGAADSPEAKGFRSATKALFAAFQTRPINPPEKPSLSLSSLKQSVMDRINPQKTVAERMKAMISLPRISWHPSDILASPILAAPEFPQPMFADLRDLSPSYLLPGADQVPPESLSLVVQNHKFIESYMVGLNHEMTRQLIWEDYPTFDQRGTYFRQFWDMSAYIAQPGDPTDPDQLKELLKDIPFVPLWNRELGQNVNRPDLPSDMVLLLIRGELFQRYPNAVVYAVKAKRNSAGQRVHDDSDQRYPIFRGTLPTDMTFLGFNLSVADCHGGTTTSPEGFFFVFQQPPSEPRFGLEPTETPTSTTRWAELSWPNFGSSAAIASRKLASMATSIQKLAGNSPWRFASQVMSMVMKDVKLPDFLSASVKPTDMGSLSDPDDQKNSWGQNSAQTAYILLRLPFRILIHCDVLLPDQP